MEERKMFKYIFMAVLGSCCATVSFGTEVPTTCPVEQGKCRSLSSGIRLPDSCRNVRRNDALRRAMPLALDDNCNKSHAKTPASEFRNAIKESKARDVDTVVTEITEEGNQ